MKRAFIAVLFVLTAAAAVYASDVLGREAVELGSLQSLSGTLSSDDGEWYLTAEGTLYAVHLGNHDFVDSLDWELKEGSVVNLSGFVYGTDIAVVNLTVGGETFHLRSEEGVPLWAGMSRGRNSDATGEGSGRMGRFAEGNDSPGGNSGCDEECEDGKQGQQS
jgi:hypothetical protein